LKLERLIGFVEGRCPKAEHAFLQTDVTHFAIDSREVVQDSVFFALSQPEYRDNCFNGDFDDATRHVASAFGRGAAACVVRPDRFEERREELERFEGRLIFVDDSIRAMQRLANRIYIGWGRPVVGITGSAGKTTAKELTAHVLSHSGRRVLRNIRNYNNGLGLPLTVFNLAADPGYDLAVLEMGMSTPHNEIRRLCRITPPDVAVELCVLPVHVEHLGSIENVAKAKAELVEGLKPGGTAVLNADDFLVAAMASLHDGPNVTFGLQKPADVTAVGIRFARFGETAFTLRTPSGEADTVFPLNGRHNIMNALAAASVGHAFGMTAGEIADALRTVEPPPQRGEVLRFKAGFTVVNDTYNSNPEALVSMVETLVEGGVGARRRVVIAGAMRELGPAESDIHFETGRRIAGLGFERLIGVEGLAARLVEGARSEGFADTAFYEDSQEAADAFVKEVRAGDVVLVKGSRGVRTEKVVEKLKEEFELE